MERPLRKNITKRPWVLISPEECHYLSYNLYFLAFLFLDNEGLHFFIRGLQANFVAFFLKPLYKHLTFDDASHDFTILYNLLRSHNNDIFIAYTIVYHAIAFDLEQEVVSIDKGIYPYKFLHLKRYHGTSGRYLSEKGQTGRFYYSEAPFFPLVTFHISLLLKGDNMIKYSAGGFNFEMGGNFPQSWRVAIIQ